MLYALPRRPSASFTVRDAPRMKGGFPEDLREFIARRLDRVDPCEESGEYRRRQEEASRLYARLMEMLSDEGRAVLSETPSLSPLILRPETLPSPLGRGAGGEGKGGRRHPRQRW